jgi:hypothetical protein
VQIILGWNWYQIDKSQQDEAEQPNDKWTIACLPNGYVVTLKLRFMYEC